MLSLLEKINELIPALPAKDINFANRFIKERDWESLKDLTWSSLQRLEIAFQKEHIPAKYVNLDIDKIRELALLCNEYYYSIYPEELEIPDDDYSEDDYEDYEENI